MSPAGIRVKICCIASVEEARHASAHRAVALGLLSAMPSRPGVIADERIAAAQPYGPELGIGVRSEGRPDAAKLDAFFTQAVRAAS